MCILKGVAAFFLVVGLLAVAAGIFFGLRTQRLSKRGFTTPGVVVENVVAERVDYDRDDHTRTISRTYRPKVRFHSQNGEEVVFESRVGFSKPPYLPIEIFGWKCLQEFLVGQSCQQVSTFVMALGTFVCEIGA